MPLFSDNCSYNPEFLLTKRASNLNEIRILWIGLLTDFKVPILNRVMKDLEGSIKTSWIKFSITILGSSDNLKQLKIPKSLNPEQVIQVESIKPEQLENFIRKYDLVFAMGTSALDAARLGIPVVRLDYSYKYVASTYRYKFLHQIEGYSLSEKIGSNFYTYGKFSMPEVLEKISTDWKNYAKKIMSTTAKITSFKPLYKN